MPYIYSMGNNYIEVEPTPGESYEAFGKRVAKPLKDLGVTDPADIQCIIDCGWNDYVLENATEAVVRLKRDIPDGAVFADPRWYDWGIAEIVSAQLPSVTYSSVEKSRAGSGERFQISKSIEDKQQVFGWANVARDANGNYPIDWSGDVTQPEDLETAAYTFVLKYRAMGEKHEGETVAQLIESVMFTKEKQQAMGIPDGVIPEGWWTGFYIPDKEVFAKVKSGEYEMFSVQGDAYRIPTGQ